MQQIYPDNGLVWMLQQVVQGTSSNFNLHLFTNNIVPSLADTVGTYTDPGHSFNSPTQLGAGDFPSSGVAAHQGYITGPPVVFTNTTGSSQTVYGYFVTDPTNTYVFASAAFDTPVVVPNGGSIPVIPVLGDSSYYT